jgi:RNA polymerase sigma-70 factor (ECF subfamily)
MSSNSQQRSASESVVALFKEYGTNLYNFVRSRVPDSDVEDVIQEIFLSVHRRHMEGAEPSRMNAYFWAIARNTVVDFYRASHRRNAMFDGTECDELADLSQDAFERMGDAERRNSLARSLSLVPSADQILLYLKYFEDLPTGEIAKLLGVPHNTVVSRILKARMRLERMAESAGVRQALLFTPSWDEWQEQMKKATLRVRQDSEK